MEFTIESGEEARSEVASFLAAVGRHDGEFPLSEYKELRLGTGDDVIELTATGPADELIGYAQAAWHPAGDDGRGHYGIEVAVGPGSRHAGVAERLLGEIEHLIGSSNATVWAHRRYVARAAENQRWQQCRRLLRMSRSLPAPCPDAASPAPITTFRPGTDDSAWLRANNLAFAGHPENGRLEQRNLDLRMAQPWFDPSGFFLAWDGSEVAGSCWTKIHPDGIGEIYIIGVVPLWAGRGLGRSLVCRGLHYLGVVRGVPRVMLYVEAENAAAIKLYDTLGFSLEKTITAFGRPVSTPQEGDES